MSNSVTTESPLLSIPRELRDQIYTYTFSDPGCFLNLESWKKAKTLTRDALFPELPGLCRANRQLFREATPVFLTSRYVESWNTSTSKQLLDIYSRFPGHVATKDVKHLVIYNWTERGTAVQLDLVSKLKHLESLYVIFTFPRIVDGVPMEKFDYKNEQFLWLETGLHYEPPLGRSIEEETAVLAKDLDFFVTRYGLHCINDMPKLRSMHFEFATNDGDDDVLGGNKAYRHRLCNPLWRWATERIMEKVGGEWGNEWLERHIGVTTNLPEDYWRVNMS